MLVHVQSEPGQKLKHLRHLGPQDQLPGAEAPGLHDTNLILEHTQHSNPRGQQLLGYINIKEEWQMKLWPCFSSSLMKRVLNFMRNPKLAHIIVLHVFTVSLESAQIGQLIN